MKNLITYMMIYLLTIHSVFAKTLGEVSNASNFSGYSIIAKSQEASAQKILDKEIAIYNKTKKSKALLFDYFKKLGKDEYNVMEQYLEKVDIKMLPEFKKNKDMYTLDIEGHQITFTIKDFYNKTFKIDGVAFEYNPKLPYKDSINRLIYALDRKRITFFSLLGINDAHADFGFTVAMVVIVGGFLIAWGSDAWGDYQVESALDEQLDALTKAETACVAANQDQAQYQSTFNLLMGKQENFCGEDEDEALCGQVVKNLGEGDSCTKVMSKMIAGVLDENFNLKCNGFTFFDEDLHKKACEVCEQAKKFTDCSNKFVEAHDVMNENRKNKTDYKNNFRGYLREVGGSAR
jgi:hypothetical protein